MAAVFSRFGADLKRLPHERYLYSYDATGISGMPDAVLHLRSIDDAVEAVRAAREAGVALVARGSGTGLSGGCVPTPGSVVLSFEHLRAIGEVDLRRMRVWIEAGVVNQSLERFLARYGVMYAPDPASHRVSTLGGNIAENSGGPRAVKYGVTGQHVTRLRVADAAERDGTLGSDETQPGLDLVSLVVGSEGTLALVTAAELLLSWKPKEIRTLLISFATMAEATDFVSAVISGGIVPAALEFLDRHSIDCVEGWGVAQYPPAAGAVLLVDLDGCQEDVTEAAERVQALAGPMGALELRSAASEAEREALWLGRRGAYPALARRARRNLSQDITVPREKLTEMLSAVDRISAGYGLDVATLGHAGDGNLHPNFGYDPDDADMSRRVHDANREILQACVELGGSISGEHGIGTDKLPYLSLMYGPSELGLMAAVKQALDPDGLFNPGKAIPMVERAPLDREGRRHDAPRSAEEVQEAVIHAASTGVPLRLRLDRLNRIQVDRENLTIEVGAGVPLDEIEAALKGTALRFPVTPMRETTLARALLLNDYGPEHLDQGLFRQSLLAATYVTGRGELVRMGRGVMKNVAGYDLVRPLVGSRGRLAVPVSYTLRLRPRSPLVWAEHAMQPEEATSRADFPDLSAVLALQEGEMLHVLACFHRRAPAGWTERTDGAEQVERVRSALRAEDYMLDLAFLPAHLPTVLDVLSVQPSAILPAAARVFLPADRSMAIDITRDVEARTGGGVRAIWGPAREPLHRLDALTAAWQDALETCFDPAGILRSWLMDGEGN